MESGMLDSLSEQERKLQEVSDDFLSVGILML